MMRRAAAATTVGLVLIGACGGSGSTERQVLVDFSPDDVATFVAQNFPKRVEITPGQTVVFKQTWTGEPHTVTGGASMNTKLTRGASFIDFFNAYSELQQQNENMVDPEDPGDATFADFVRELARARPVAARKRVIADYNAIRRSYPDMPALDSGTTMAFHDFDQQHVEGNADKAFEDIPFAMNDDGDLNQNVAQACFLKSGSPPEDPDTSCTPAQQKQPVFDGKQSFYNSGVLPYEGTRGNTYRVKFAPTTTPGSYYFYCAIHGLGQLSEIVVRKPGTKIPSAAAVARRARQQANAVVTPLAKTFRDARRANVVRYHGETFKAPLAGLPAEIHGSINEFVPQTLHAKVNEPITWTFLGTQHTLSFDVPAYLPILQFGAHRIRLNPRVSGPAGGAPKPPEQAGDEPLRVDGGTYDGSGFWSSGLIGSETYATYTLRISKPGTYPYACLIHPKMIAKVVVT